MKKHLRKALSWVLALSLLVSCIPALDIGAAAESTNRETAAAVGENTTQGTAGGEIPGVQGKDDTESGGQDTHGTKSENGSLGEEEKETPEAREKSKQENKEDKTALGEKDGTISTFALPDNDPKAKEGAVNEFTAGDFTVKTDVVDGYKYVNNTLTLTKSGSYTISGTTTKDSIAVASDVNVEVTLTVNIDISDKSCFNIYDGSTGDVTIILKGENVMKTSNSNSPAIQKRGSMGNVGTLTIKGDGSLEAIGGGRAAGIGADSMGSTKNIVIEGGNIKVGNSQSGPGIGTTFVLGTCSDIYIKGGTVETTGIHGGGTSNIVITGGSVKTSKFGCTPVDGQGREVVLLKTDVLTEPVSVDGVDYKINGKHNRDSYLYLYVTKGEHTITHGPDNKTEKVVIKSDGTLAVGQPTPAIDVEIESLKPDFVTVSEPENTDKYGAAKYQAVAKGQQPDEEKWSDSNKLTRTASGQAFVGGKEYDIYVKYTGKEEFYSDKSYYKTVKIPILAVGNFTPDLPDDLESAVNYYLYDVKLPDSYEWNHWNTKTDEIGTYNYDAYMYLDDYLDEYDFTGYPGYDEKNKRIPVSIPIKIKYDGATLLEDIYDVDRRGIVGGLLSDVKLPQGWSWNDDSIQFPSELGLDFYEAVFDTSAYEEEYSFVHEMGYNPDEKKVRMKFAIHYFLDGKVFDTVSSVMYVKPGTMLSEVVMPEPWYLMYEEDTAVTAGPMKVMAWLDVSDFENEYYFDHISGYVPEERRIEREITIEPYAPPAQSQPSAPPSSSSSSSTVTKYRKPASGSSVPSSSSDSESQSSSASSASAGVSSQNSRSNSAEETASSQSESGFIWIILLILAAVVILIVLLIKKKKDNE